MSEGTTGKHSLAERVVLSASKQPSEWDINEREREIALETERELELERSRINGWNEGVTENEAGN